MLKRFKDRTPGQCTGTVDIMTDGNGKHFEPRREGLGIILAFLAVSLAASGLCAGQAARRTNPRQITFEVEYTCALIHGGLPKALLVALPIPVSDEYQDIEITDRGRGSLLNIPETRDMYLTFRKVFKVNSGNIKDKILTMRYTVDATLYDVVTDFSVIDSFYPVTESLAPYTTHTRSVDKFILPTHPDIMRMARKIAVEYKVPEHNPLAFARAAFQYVVENFRLTEQKRLNGLSRLEQTLRSGSGHSGELVNVYTSLLRNRKIPCRQLVGVTLDGRPHVFADFYLQEYGWIPVDVANQIIDPKADFFGRTQASTRPVIMTHGLNLSVVPMGWKREKVDFLQLFSRWYKPHISSVIGRFRDTYVINGYRIVESEKKNKVSTSKSI